MLFAHGEALNAHYRSRWSVGDDPDVVRRVFGKARTETDRAAAGLRDSVRRAMVVHPQRVVDANPQAAEMIVEQTGHLVAGQFFAAVKTPHTTIAHPADPSGATHPHTAIPGG